MKRIIFVPVLLLAAATGFSQNFNVQTAANEYKGGTIARAKEAIDAAAANQSTANDPKMWYYRAEIYLKICNDTTAVGKSELDAPEKSAISFMNCLKTDKSKNYTDLVNSDVWIPGVYLYNKAAQMVPKGDYERANRFYNLIFDIIPLDKENNLKRNNITPETIYKNLYLVAKQARDTVKSKEYLQKLMDIKYNDPLIYYYMSNIYLDQKDTAKALTYLELGRQRFEENQKLFDEEYKIYFAQGKLDLLIRNLNNAIDATPENEILYFTRGSLYGKQKQLDKAEADYKKAIELKPDYFEPNYYLGVLYFNNAADKLESISSIKNQEQYAKEKEKCEAMYSQSLPYLETAHQAKPKDVDTMTWLKQIYFRQNKMDQYNKIKAELDASGSKEK